MSADQSRGLVREYGIEFRARWFSHLPWPKRRIFMSKLTTWPEVNELADQLIKAGCTDVSIQWAKDAA